MQQHSNPEWKPELCIPFSSASSVRLSFEHSTIVEQSCFEGYHHVILFLFFSKIENNCWDGLLWICVRQRIVHTVELAGGVIIEITEVQSVVMLGFHKLCCHVGISQIMLPCFGVHKFCFQWQKVTNCVTMLGFHKLCCHVLEFTNFVFSDKKKG